MSRLARTRFYAEIDGRDKELLQIKDRRDRGLVILSATPRLFERESGSFVEYAEQHYSVHWSNAGRDTTITQKTTFADGTNQSIVSYINGTSRQLLWPVYARRVPRLDTDNRNVVHRSGETLIKVGAYRYATACLCYSVFAAKGVDVATLPVDVKCTCFAADFRDASVIVIATYLKLPSPFQGDLAGWATSPPVFNQVKWPGHDRLRANASSIAPAGIMNVHWTLMEMLRMQTLNRVAKLLRPEKYLQAAAIADTFSRYPLILGDVVSL